MKNRFNNLGFKTWLYFVIFAISIILLLQFFQLILFEPFYKNVCKDQVVDLNNEIKDVVLSDVDNKEEQIRNLTANNNACVLVIDTDTLSTNGYDSLGQNCALYSDGVVNEELVDQFESSKEDTVFLSGKYSESSSETLMIYGQKTSNDDSNYLILSNIALNSSKNFTKTIMKQLTILSFIMLFLSIIMAIGFSNLVASPIINLTNQAKKIKQGNFEFKNIKSNINEIDELDSSLAQAAEDLNRVELLRKELLSNVSHDLRTPLTMIKAYAEMIKDISGDNKEKRDEHLDVIINETDNLNDLVTNVLDLSKLQDGVIQVNKEPFDFSGLINDCVNKFNSIINDDLIIDCKCEAELVAIGDKTRINEVVNNFIGNAIKHGSEGKKIVVEAYLEKNKIKCKITDFGNGIKEEDIPYIWDRYYKTNKQYKRSVGSGLGLSINKAILLQHKSNFGVESKVNEFTTFYFDLDSQSID